MAYFEQNFSLSIIPKHTDVLQRLTDIRLIIYCRNYDCYSLKSVPLVALGDNICVIRNSISNFNNYVYNIHITNKLDRYNKHLYICVHAHNVYTCKNIHMHMYRNNTNYLIIMSSNSIMPMLVSVPAGNRGHTQIRVIGEDLLRIYYKGKDRM